MMGRAGPPVLFLLAALVAAALPVPPALAQRAPVTPAQAPASPPAAPETASRSQNISLPAGTGMLLRLPAPAATVMSADPGVARVQPASPTSLFLMGVAPGRTTVVATADSGSAIVQYDVNVGPSGSQPKLPTAEAVAPGPPRNEISAATVSQIQLAIARLVPGAQGVQATAVGSRLVLNGIVPTPAAAQQAEAIARGYAGERTIVLSELAVLTSIQVNVRVRIAEISRTITRQLGFNWQALGANGNNWRFGLLTGAATGGAISPLLPLGMSPFQSAPAVPNQLGAGFRSGNGNWDVNGIIDALAADQLIAILAEPNLTAQSGETASFLAGGEFPIPIAGNSSNGTTTITVDFKQFGVSLAVVPTVLSPTRLNLRVRPEVSQLTNNGAVSVPIQGGTLTIPALTVRRAETTVELGSGQSFAIAGLLQKTTTDVTTALPGIGELPVIGALFKSNNFQRGESELVIIVTPYLVKPAPNPQALRLPTDGFRPATDLDRVLLGHQLAPGPSGAPLDAGFILK
ncbi:MAG: type II and III secretion system protein family protein [Acetobacteraceae bacterium]